MQINAEPSLAENPVDTRYAARALIGSAVGFAMDGFDLLILGFMLNIIAVDLQLTPQQAGSLVTWTLGGAVVGGVFFGRLSDSYGRIRVLTWTIVLFGVFTGACAFATGYWDLAAYRALAGLGLGGEFGIGMALAAEAWSDKKRARVSSYVALGWQGGVLMAAFGTALLVPHVGWRGMFLIGVVPAIIAVLLRLNIQEPPRYLELRTGARGKIAELFKDTATAKVSIGIAILCAVQNFGYYGIMIWLPNYLTSQFGFDLTRSATWTAVLVIGMCAGILIFGQLADRVGRKPMFIIFQIGAGVSVVVYSQLRDPLQLLVGGAIMGAFVNGMMGGYGALLSEAYPTKLRATAQNVLFNFGRAIGGFGPFVIALVAARWSFPTAVGMLCFIYVLDLLVTISLIPERKGAPLD